MRIITETCPNCGTIVAGNVLASERVMNCPDLGCEQIFSFEDLSPEDRQYVREHAARERT